MPIQIDIIIIFKKPDAYLLECVSHCLSLDYPHFSLILLPDEVCELPFTDERIRIIPTGNATIPVKRNIGIKNTTEHSAFVAFVDSDAFPAGDWLSNAIKYFNDSDVYAVGGPNLTPGLDSLSRKITGYVMAQTIAFGTGAVRHRIAKAHYSQELPTCNLIIRKSFFLLICFDETLVTGEDAKICADIISKGYKIQYAPDVLVYHHRRRLLKPFLLQFYNYGYDKGSLFVRGIVIDPKNLAPSLFVILLFIFIGLQFIFPAFRIIFLTGCGLYFTLCLFSSLATSGNLWLSPLIAIMIFLGHISYGSGFLRSLADKILWKNKNIIRNNQPNDGKPDTVSYCLKNGGNGGKKRHRK